MVSLLIINSKDNKNGKTGLVQALSLPQDRALHVLSPPTEGKFVCSVVNNTFFQAVL